MPNFPYKQIGTEIDRNFRNVYNQTLEDIEQDIKDIGGSAVGATEAAEEAHTQALYAAEQGDYANEKGTYAEEQGLYAKNVADLNVEKGDYAKKQGDYALSNAMKADSAANNADLVSGTLSTLKTAINGKITEANTAITALNNFNHQGTYSPATKYFPRNVVDYNGSSYMNIAESTGALPTDTTKWKPVATKGDQGLKGDIGNIADAWQGAYSASKAYAKGNLTSYNGRVYIAKSASTGNLPTNTTYWDIFSDKGSDGAGSVNSVNGKTGSVTLDAQEVGAIPESQKGVAGGVALINADGKVVDASGTLVEGAVKSVNGQTGAVTIPLATTSADGLFSSTEKTKLNGIATGANNYTHPSTHPASIITQDASNRFVTDTEKTAWNLSESNAKNYADSLVANASSNFNRSLYKEVANLQLQSEATKRVTNGATFGLTSDTSFGMTIDTFKAKSATALSVGATTITLDSVSGLTVGKEVTIFDDINLERRTATAINGNVITVPALTKSFKSQVSVARSMHIIDSVNKTLTFGGWNWTQTVTQVDKVVIASAYSTSTTARPIRLSNGWLVAAVANEGVSVIFYKSMDDGATWSQLAFRAIAFTGLRFSIISKGTMIHALFTSTTNTGVFYVGFNATTVSNDSTLIAGFIDSNQTAIDNCSLAIDSTGTLHAVWASKNTSYPNSFNIRQVKSVDGGISWSAVVQRTTSNVANNDYYSPIMLTISNGYGRIIARIKESSGKNSIVSFVQLAVDSWTFVTIHDALNYTAENPTVAVDKDGVVIVAWNGFDATHPSTSYVRFAKSTDAGLTYTAMQKLITGSNPSISTNASGKYFITYVDAGVTKIIESSDKGTTWSTPVNLGTGTSPSSLTDITFESSIPPTIRNGSSSVLLSATWSNPKSEPILENDIRFTTADTNEVVTWVQHDEGLTVDATLNGQNMTKTPTSTTEDRFLGTLATKGATDVNLRFKRASTSDEKKVYKILGGIG